MLYLSGDFDYSNHPDLFLGRVGRGPLVVAWDTDILLDYLEHGRALWGDEGLKVEGTAYREELETLGGLVDLYFVADIRFVVTPRNVSDARRELAEDRVRVRTRASRELTKALALASTGQQDDAVALESLGPDPGPGPGLGQLALWPDEVLRVAQERPVGPPPGLGGREAERALAGIPKGGDRDLVREALESGSHVFLTRDRLIRRSAPAFAPLGLLLARPTELLDRLVTEAFTPAPGDSGAPCPDLQRVSHLIQALG